MRFIILAAITCFGLVSCTKSDSNDGSSDGRGPSTNACQLIGLSEKIINGTECQSESRSPVVRVEIVTGANRLSLCSGTMIAPNAVLTAAHCFNERALLVQIEVAGRAYPASRVTLHPDFRQGSGALINDAAIIRLVSSPGLPTLPIGISRAVRSDDIVSIFGFGVDEDEDGDVLRSGQSRVDNVTTEHIQVIYDGNGSNTCQGDSGGPALIAINGQQTVVGVTSTGTVGGCGEGDDSRFTNLQKPSVLSFIRQQVPEALTR